MEKQQSYSHGLLYSVAPDNFAALHLNDEVGKDGFDWEAYEAEYKGDSLVRIVLNFMKTTAHSWGIIKLH
jgi:hypothetical protein